MAFTQMKHVDSTMIEAIAYDSGAEELLIRFSDSDAKTGRKRPRKSYVYGGVPKYVYDELIATNRRPHGSVGKVFYSLVRQEAGYPFALVHVDA